MIIFALDDENVEFRNLLNQIEGFASLEIFDDFEFLVETTLGEDCHGVIINYDHDPKNTEKYIKLLKKQKKNIPLFLFTNDLDSKKIIKHQKSKTGASLYLQTPIDKEMLFMMIEPFWQGENPAALRAKDQNLIDTHGAGASKELSEAAEIASKDIDGALSAIFPEEYMEDEKIPDHKLANAEEPLEEIDLNLDDENDEEVEANFPDEEDLTFPELDLSEMDMSENNDEDSNLGLSLAEDEPSAEIQLTEDSGDDLSLSQEENDSPELSLDGESSNDLNLSLGEDDSSEQSLQEDNDDDLGLSFGEDESPELVLEEDSDDELSLSQEENDSSELSLDEESSNDLNLSIGEDDSPELSLDEDNGDDLNLEFGEDDSPELSLDEDNGDDLNLKFGDDDSPELSLEEENDDDLNLSLDEDEASETAELSLSEDSVDDSEPGAELPGNIDDFSLDLSDDSEEIEDNLLDDNKIDELSSDVGAESDLKNLLANRDEVDDELTRPAFENEMLGELQDVEEEEDTKTSVAHNDDEESDSDFTEVGFEDNFEATIMGLSLDESSPEPEPVSEKDDVDLESEDNSSSFDDDMTQIFTPPKSEETNISQRVSHVGAETKTTIESNNMASEHRSYVQSHDDELVRLGETINGLRSDREALLNKISKMENKETQEKEDLLNLKAQLDEKNIELVVVKKRLEKKTEDLQVQLDISLDKRAFLEKKNQSFALEIERLSKEKRLDHSRVHQRERELEERLEMLRKDSEIQLRNRDQKILELKRRIDSLEFDIESMRNKERNSMTQQVDLEDKMDSVIKTLRTAIGQLEEDHIAQEKRLQIKKNLKV